MTGPLNINGYVATTNYLSSDFENLSLVGVKVNSQNFSATAAVGSDVKYSNDECKNALALEAKVTYNLPKDFRVAARFREIDGAEQYRVTAGRSFLKSNLGSAYADTHCTLKHDNKGNNLSGGIWAGYSFKFKNCPNLNVWTETQKNVKPANWKLDENWSFNAGVTYNF